MPKEPSLERIMQRSGDIEITPQTIAKYPGLLDMMKKESRYINRSRYGLEDAIGYIRGIEDAIKQGGWNEGIEEGAYQLMGKLYRVEKKNPELRKTIDTMIDQVYSTIKKHRPNGEHRIPGEFDAVYSQLKTLLEVPQKTRELEDAVRNYRNQSRGMSRYTHMLILLAMIMGTMGAYYIGDISITGYHIAEIEKASQGLFGVLIMLVMFTMVILVKIKQNSKKE